MRLCYFKLICGFSQLVFAHTPEAWKVSASHTKKHGEMKFSCSFWDPQPHNLWCTQVCTQRIELGSIGLCFTGESLDSAPHPFCAARAIKVFNNRVQNLSTNPAFGFAARSAQGTSHKCCTINMQFNFMCERITPVPFQVSKFNTCVVSED